MKYLILFLIFTCSICKDFIHWEEGTIGNFMDMKLDNIGLLKRDRETIFKLYLNEHKRNEGLLKSTINYCPNAVLITTWMDIRLSACFYYVQKRSEFLIDYFCKHLI